MGRRSESKLIKDQVKHDRLFKDYIDLLEKLTSNFSFIKKKEYSKLVNFKTNKEMPRHRWFEYKQGYSSQLMSKIIENESISSNHYIMDPFTGVGTTNLVAQNFGFESIGFDINPVATFAAIVKTNHFTNEEIHQIERLIFDFKPVTTINIPDSPLLERSFSKKSFNSLMGIKGFYESIKNKKIKNFFALAYLSIIESVSTRVKDGNGIKIAKNKKEIDNVSEYYRERCSLMLKDIYKINPEVETTIINGSILEDDYYKKVRDKKVGLVIFSPPYANCFDYCEVYKLEFWMGGFVSGYSDFKTYRKMAIRSHVNSKFDHNIKNENNSAKLISDLVSCYNLWNKNIPDMIRGYFDDMEDVLFRLRQIMVDDSKCFIVVANSGYKGILVPTDLLLSEIAEKLGFKVNQISYARKIRASSQQMADLHNYEDLMRESIVELQK